MNDEIINKLASFIQCHNKYEDRELIKKYLDDHNKYGTLDYAVDTGGRIIAIVRWNVKDEIAEVLDMAVNEEYRNMGIGRDFVKRAISKFPNIKYLEFKRGVRGDERKRIMNIKHILKRNIF